MDVLSISREVFTPKSTIGTLSVLGYPFCSTLEDTCRGQATKVYGETAIPSGRYRLTIEHSNRYARLMPRLHGIPGWPNDDVLIHWGNGPADTKGCILVGKKSEIPDWIGFSHATFDKLFTRLTEIAKTTPEMWISVNGGLDEKRIAA